MFQRDFFILIGPNGSGKTTLMKVLSGILNAEGTLQIQGRSVKDFRYMELARKIAFVPRQISDEFPFTVQQRLKTISDMINMICVLSCLSEKSEDNFV